MIKRIITIILAFMLINSMSLFSAFGAADDTDLNDEYTYASELLLAVCPDMPAGDEGNYTRAEFVAAVVELLNLSLNAPSAGFSDVPSTNKYAAHIDMAVSLGLVNSQNVFYPNDPITYVQAVKIVTTAIGYAPRADILGGYPTGYIRAAREAEIGKNIQLSNDALVSYTEGAALLYDMAVADMLQITGFGDTFEYSLVEGENILSMYYDIHIHEGLLNANEYTGLYSKIKNTGKGTIKVDDTEFSGGDFYGLIGQNVRVFYKDDGKNTVVYAYPADNKILEFDPEYSLKLTDNKLTVAFPDENSKDKTYTLSDDYSVIHNGKNLAADDFSSYVNPKAGSVTFVDNDDNGKYDVIIIEEIQYGFIEKVNVIGAKIYDKFKPDSMIDLSDPDTRYFIYDAAGNITDLDSVEANTAAGYIMSVDKDLVEIRLYDNVYGGVISEKSSEGEIKIRDNFYKLSDYYTAIKSMDDLAFGSEVICYIGEGNDIIYMEHISGDTSYAFLVAAATFGGLDSDVKVKLMTSKKGMSVFSLADKVNINGIVKSKDKALEDITAIINKADPYRTVKYCLNSDGRINKIFSGVIMSELADVFAEQSDNDAPKAFLGNEEAYRPVYYSEGILSPNFIPNASTEVIMIPEAADEKLDDSNYEALDYQAFKKDGNYDVIAYDVNSGGVPKFIVVYTDSGLTEVGELTAGAIVEKMYTTVDSDGNVVDCIKAFSGGNYVSYYVTSETSAAAKDALSEVEPGDIIRITYNNKNEVIAAVHDYDASERKRSEKSDKFTGEHAFTGAKSGAYIEFIHGYIYGFSGTNALLVSKNADLSGGISPEASIMINLGRGTTVFCRINKTRDGKVIDAEIFTEPDFSIIETVHNSGADADYMVARQRFRSAGLNVIYVE